MRDFKIDQVDLILQHGLEFVQEEIHGFLKEFDDDYSGDEESIFSQFVKKDNLTIKGYIFAMLSNSS
jgi:hypothetical protein